MKANMFKSLIGLSFISCMLYFSHTAHATEQNPVVETDTSKVETTTFKNVEVLLETEWGLTQKINGVNVEIKSVNNHPSRVNILSKKDDSRQSEILIMDGVKIKIFDQKSGLLKWSL